MCLTITGFRTRKEAREFKPFIAEKDIKVYKLLTEDNKSIFKYFQFDKGYHYSVKRFTKNTEFGLYSRQWKLNISKGLHAYVSLKKAKEVQFGDEKIVIMYIPARSQYYLGINGDIVSDNLIWY